MIVIFLSIHFLPVCCVSFSLAFHIDGLLKERIHGTSVEVRAVSPSPSMCSLDTTSLVSSNETVVVSGTAPLVPHPKLPLGSLHSCVATYVRTVFLQTNGRGASSLLHNLQCAT